MKKVEAITVRLEPPLREFVAERARQEDRSLASTIRRMVADAKQRDAHPEGIAA